MNNLVIRKASINDIDLLIQARLDYFKFDSHYISDINIKNIKLQLTEYFKTHIPDNTLIGVIAEIENKIASVALLVISEKPANPFFVNGKTGRVLNVLTYPEYRKMGIATKVLNMIIKEAKQNDLSIIELNATTDGKPVYEKLGFTKSEYTAMNLLLKI